MKTIGSFTGRVIGNETSRGCPYCNQFAVTSSEDGRFVVYRAALGCCLPRVVQELAWRLAEHQRLVAVKRDARGIEEELRELRQHLRDWGAMTSARAQALETAKAQIVRLGGEAYAAVRRELGLP